jgi:hypothetical protein
MLQLCADLNLDEPSPDFYYYVHCPIAVTVLLSSIYQTRLREGPKDEPNDAILFRYVSNDYPTSGNILKPA